MKITWLGHSTVVIDMAGVRLVTDPLLRRHAGLLRRRGGKPAGAAWAGTDAILLSHLHHDHADLASLRMLGDVPVLAAADNATWLDKHGLRGSQVNEDGWVRVGPGAGVEVRLTHAVHHSRPMPHRPNAACGHLVRAPSGVVIWAAGDTSLFPELEATTGTTAGVGVDVAIVPVSGWGPRLSPGHMGPGEAAVACHRVGARWGVPVHWGTLHVPFGRHIPPHWMDSAGPTFEAALAREAPGCRPSLLTVGGSVTIPDGDDA